METTARTRPSWDEYFMQIVRLVATRSTCLRRQVGAAFVKNKNILATGYNGAPAGVLHCEETGCLRKTLGIPSGERHEICRGLHAEQNGIIQAARHGINLSGATVYVTDSPCIICAKMLINVGVERIVCQEGYPDQLSLDMLSQAGLEIELHGPVKDQDSSGRSSRRRTQGRGHKAEKAKWPKGTRG